VLVADHLPELGPDLVPALPALDVQDLPHGCGGGGGGTAAAEVVRALGLRRGGRRRRRRRAVGGEGKCGERVGGCLFYWGGVRVSRVV
jgi:hypothetical protein